MSETLPREQVIALNDDSTDSETLELSTSKRTLEINDGDVFRSNGEGTIEKTQTRKTVLTVSSRDAGLAYGTPGARAEGGVVSGSGHRPVQSDGDCVG